MVMEGMYASAPACSSLSSREWLGELGIGASRAKPIRQVMALLRQVTGKLRFTKLGRWLFPRLTSLAAPRSRSRQVPLGGRGAMIHVPQLPANRNGSASLTRVTGSRGAPPRVRGTKASDEIALLVSHGDQDIHRHACGEEQVT